MKPLDLANLKGKVRITKAFADYKVKVMPEGGKLRVKKVTRMPELGGEWQFVENGEDFTIEIVSAHEDFTISYVHSFPGVW